MRTGREAAHLARAMRRAMRARSALLLAGRSGVNDRIDAGLLHQLADRLLEIVDSVAHLVDSADDLVRHLLEATLLRQRGGGGLRIRRARARPRTKARAARAICSNKLCTKMVRSWEFVGASPSGPAPAASCARAPTSNVIGVATAARPRHPPPWVGEFARALRASLARGSSFGPLPAAAARAELEPARTR